MESSAWSLHLGLVFVHSECDHCRMPCEIRIFALTISTFHIIRSYEDSISNISIIDRCSFIYKVIKSK